jgi:hypothetical protein
MYTMTLFIRIINFLSYDVDLVLLNRLAQF